MAGFQPAITIIDAIGKISKREYLLPAFQREYVWSCEQIERLFDSLMRGYPISSMLFWRVRGENKNKWQFYEFLDKYREKYYIHNKKFDTSLCNDFYAILDGQQRLTSVYLALCGNYDTHRYRKSWDNQDKNFHICDFYFNLTGSEESKNADVKYEFLWLDREVTKGKIIYKDKFNQKWFKCKHILNLQDNYQFINFLSEKENLLAEDEIKNISDFHTLIFSTKDNTRINYYLEEDDNPDKAINIFIRINSGGTRLDYSDILFSYAIANWQEKDARTEINELVDRINQNLNFNISKDLILKSFLFLYHNKIQFKINSFDNGFIKEIENRWGDIKYCIEQTFNLIRDFGLNKYTLSSNNTVLPIIYYIYHKNLSDKIVDSVLLKDVRKTIEKYLLRTIILKPFSGSADTVLTNVRKAFVKDFDGVKFFDRDFALFPIKEIENSYKFSISNIDDEFLNELMECRKDSPEAFAVLSMLFINLDMKNIFHKDHLHPVSSYKDYEKMMKSQNRDSLDFIIYDSLPNLQLLDANENMSKNNRSLKEWIEIECKNKDDAFRESFLNSKFIPNIDLSLENFNNFYVERKYLLINKLKEILDI